MGMGTERAAWEHLSGPESSVNSHSVFSEMFPLYVAMLTRGMVGFSSDKDLSPMMKFSFQHSFIGMVNL